MQREYIAPNKFKLDVFKTLSTDWMLLTSGDFSTKHCNTMTVAWGSFGMMWNKPFAMVAVRPGRYTYEFMEKYDSFTLCAFPEKYKHALNLCGTVSGRDADKIKAANITLEASSRIAAPSFAEASLVFECRKIYFQDFDCKNFLDPAIEKVYPEKDYHRMYFGEVLSVEAAPGYSA